MEKHFEEMTKSLDSFSYGPSPESQIWVETIFITKNKFVDWLVIFGPCFQPKHYYIYFQYVIN